MEVEQLLGSYGMNDSVDNSTGKTDVTGVDNSEPTSVEGDSSTRAATPADGADNGSEVNGNGNGQAGSEEGVASDENRDKDSEPSSDGQKKAYNNKNNQRQRPFSRLEKAEFKAEKWKRKAREMRNARDSVQAEFDHYKAMDPRAFDNEEDRMQYLAWKASTQQRLNDMDDDIQAIESEGERERYSAKIADCYNERGAAEYEKLDDHYGDAFSFVCQRIDPDNVIVDFLAGSRYEPAMRNVIYRNGKLQEELFKQFRNPTIAASERLRILKNLESQVADFYNRSRTQKSSAPGAATPNAAPQQGQPARQQTAPVQQRRFVLPSTQQNQQPQQRTAIPNRGNVQPRSRQVTGSLTRGSEPAGQMDERAAVNSLLQELRGAGL